MLFPCETLVVLFFVFLSYMESKGCVVFVSSLAAYDMYWPKLIPRFSMEKMLMLRLRILIQKTTADYTF